MSEKPNLNEGLKFATVVQNQTGICSSGTDNRGVIVALLTSLKKAN